MGVSGLEILTVVLSPVFGDTHPWKVWKTSLISSFCFPLIVNGEVELSLRIPRFDNKHCVISRGVLPANLHRCLKAMHVASLLFALEETAELWLTQALLYTVLYTVPAIISRPPSPSASGLSAFPAAGNTDGGTKGGGGGGAHADASVMVVVAVAVVGGPEQHRNKQQGGEVNFTATAISRHQPSAWLGTAHWQGLVFERRPALTSCSLDMGTSLFSRLLEGLTGAALTQLSPATSQLVYFGQESIWSHRWLFTETYTTLGHL